MKPTRTLLPILLFAWSAFAQAQTAFQKVIELPTDTVDARLRPFIITSDGGYMFFLQQDTVRALVKLDQNGDLLWSKAYPVVASEAFTVIDLAPTTDGGAVVMLESSEDPDFSVHLCHVGLARIDAGGGLVWTKRYNLPFDEFSLISRTELMTNGADEFFVRITPIQPSSDPHRILKISGTGDVLWCTYFNEWQGDELWRSLYPAQGGGCFMINWANFSNGPNSVSLYDGSGNLVWGRSVRMTNANWMSSPGTAIQSSSGEIYLLGHQMSIGAPSQSFGYLIKIALNGDLDWYRIYGDGNNKLFASEVVELPSGDLRFGSADVYVFDTDGNQLSHEQRSFSDVVMGTMTYSLPLEGLNSHILNGGFVQANDWTKTDSFWGYSWYKPVISAVPWDLSGICGWDSTTIATVSDTAVPPAFIEYLTLTNSGPSPYTYADTTTISVNVPLTVSDFCTLLSVGDVAAPVNSLQVYPSVLSAGMPINAQVEGATRMELLDARGRSVQVLSAQHDAHVSFNTSALRQGLYLIRAMDGKGLLLGTARVVVE